MTYADRGTPVSDRPSPSPPRTPRIWADMRTDDEVPVRTRAWSTAIMIPAGVLSSLIYVSFAAQPYITDPHGGRYLWLILSTLLSIPFPFLLLARTRQPETTFWICCAVTALFPYGTATMLMSLCALLSRRDGRMRTIRAVAAATATAVWAQLRDATRPPDQSFWRMVFAKPGTGVDGVPVTSLVSDAVIIATAIVAALLGTAIAILVGFTIRSRARLAGAQARTHAAVTHAMELRHDLSSQQLADAIAAEAHDTLAHTLSLIALNASALQAQVGALEPSDGTRDIARQTEEIRRLAAGALDEAHAIIDMLRDPAQAWEQLAPSDDTSLTRESLDALITDVRGSGAQLNTWIDIRQLSGLDEAIGKVAYRAMQEGLTNARRHAPGAPVSLETSAAPQTGVHIHLSNPMPQHGGREPGAQSAHGAGLPGLAARVDAVGGRFRYGVDDRRLFHVDVWLPWRDQQRLL